MYPDESSRVLVYWFKSHSMFECFVYWWLWKRIRLLDEIILCSSLPYFYCCVFCCDTLFCDDHQLVDVSRCEEHSWSTGRWWFHCL